jgi:plastocyanin
MKFFDRPSRMLRALLCGVALLPLHAQAQSAQPHAAAELHAHIDIAPGQLKGHPPAAVVWLTPMSAEAAGRTLRPGHFTLVQKNRMFMPHLLVVPVGSVVSFPNEDPFFHNVFSYFNGKRFDLGLYEAGKSKDVVFSREGVSYIFCNIHPEMSAVVLALSTPYFATADQDESLRLENISAGEYEMHVWIEGLTQPDLARLVRRIHLNPGKSESISLDARELSHESAEHLNKFGQPYDRSPKPAY